MGKLERQSKLLRSTPYGKAHIDEAIRLVGPEGVDVGKLGKSGHPSARIFREAYLEYQRLCRLPDGDPIEYEVERGERHDPFPAAKAVVDNFSRAFRSPLVEDYRTIWSSQVITVERRVVSPLPTSTSPILHLGEHPITIQAYKILPGLSINGKIIAAPVERVAFNHNYVRSIPEGKDPFIDRAKRGLRKYEKGIRFRKPKKMRVSRVIETFGSDRCLSGGVPTFMAENLLKGLRKPVSLISTMERVGTHGVQRNRYGVSQHQLATAGLMCRHPGNGKVRERYTTTYYGFMLLRHWAEKRKDFKPYLDAYARKGDEERLATQEMLERL